MRSVTYSMGISLDGYIVGPDGGFDWTALDPAVFRFWIDEIREVGVHLMGRRLYETMLYWETADQDPSLGDAELEWAALWKPLPKVVFSSTLSAVQGHARLASGGLAAEIERLRAEPGEGDIAIGGATLAVEAAALDLIDEYRVMVYPVLVGGGIPYFPAARAPGGSRTRRDPHLQLDSRLSPLPRRALARLPGLGWLEMPLDLGFELRFRQRSDDAVDDLAVAQDDQRRDAARIESTSQTLVLVDVDLDHLEATGVLMGELVEDRRHEAARPAPGCPEIDHDRRLRSGLDVEARFVGVDDPGQGLATVAAMRCAALARTDPVSPAAVRAHERRKGRSVFGVAAGGIGG